MMKKNYSQITTFIILFSIVTVILQFATYYFINSFLLVIGISSALCLLCTRILLQVTKNYGACFSYSLLNVLLSFIIIILSYLGNTQGLFPFEEKLYLFILINWLVPHLNSIFTDMIDTQDKNSGFKTFFRNSSIVFGVFYFLGILNFLFINNTDYFLIETDLTKVNFIPFYTLATLIEHHISGVDSLHYVGTYLLQGIIPFIPYGFYIILLLRRQWRLLQFVALLLFPILIEVLQWITFLGKADIEDILLGLLGGFIGALIYLALNTLHNRTKDRDFLTNQVRYNFYRETYRF